MFNTNRLTLIPGEKYVAIQRNDPQNIRDLVFAKVVIAQDLILLYFQEGSDENQPTIFDEEDLGNWSFKRYEY